MVYRNLHGVPDFESTEYSGKNTKYCLCFDFLSPYTVASLEKAQPYIIIPFLKILHILVAP